jgi:hypothetical protein
MAKWWPRGTASSIGATYLHVVIDPDVELPTSRGSKGYLGGFDADPAVASPPSAVQRHL